ncbi:MAG: ATP-dependent Clp protease adaptor ClpS [Bacteroidaceae bacterium]|nr:ATP-dependent Clp protease adaptor ClpS [Bacteroidaceae bacterium]
MEKQQTQNRFTPNTRFQEPRRYQVVMLNDDFTTMEFVVQVLETVFYKSGAEAERLMLAVHQQGMAVVGTYSLDMARTKADRAMQMAREEGFPLQVNVQPE